SVPIPYILRFSSSLLHYTAFFFSCVGSYLFFAYRKMPKNLDNPDIIRDVIKEPALQVIPIAIYQ
ncbi:MULTISPECIES: hypothetical protein, partial [unclassified Neglectibacter]|uniref:hypothetical protein n=1 Tax=unclassified Neglectibacter TaxID=2632164 RepID=UPI001A9A7849